MGNATGLTLAVALFIYQMAIPSGNGDRQSLCVAKASKRCYSTVQAAVDAAGNGAVIRVAPGRFEENIVIQQALTLSGGVDDSASNPIATGETVLVGRITASRAITISDLIIIGWITTREDYALQNVRIGAAITGGTERAATTAQAAQKPIATPDSSIATSAALTAPPSVTALPIAWIADTEAPGLPTIQSPASTTSAARAVANGAAVDQPLAVFDSLDLNNPALLMFIPVYGLMTLLVIAIVVSNARIAAAVNLFRRSHQQESERANAVSLEQRRADLQTALASRRGWVPFAAQMLADALAESVEIDGETALVNVTRVPVPSFTLSLSDGRVAVFTINPRDKGSLGMSGLRVVTIDLSTINSQYVHDAQTIWWSLAGVSRTDPRTALPMGCNWFVIVFTLPVRVGAQHWLFALGGRLLAARARLGRLSTRRGPALKGVVPAQW